MPESVYEPEHPWGTCQHQKCETISVRCEWGMCKEHCAKRHLDSTGTMLHATRTAEEEARLHPTYTPKPPKLVAKHKFLEDAA